MSAADRKLRCLKYRKRSIVTSFAAIKSFVSSYQEDKDKCEVPVRLENLIALWKEFNDVQAELETLEEAEDVLESYLKERTDFERVYYRVKGTLLLWTQPAVQPQSATNQSANVDQISNIKLPDIKLPIFCGEFDKWLNFHDLFISLVHSSTSLSTIQKFFYLRSSLAGEALELIQTIPISNEQYSVAWNLLETHYHNKRRLKRNYVQSLFEFPVIKRESAAELHTLIDKFQTNVKILKQLGEKTDHWDVLLVHLLSTRLDAITRRDWEEHAETNNATKFQELVDFLQHRVNVLETINSNSSEIPPTSKKINPPRAGNYGAVQQTFRPCPACSNQHSLYQCGTFSEMAIEEKDDVVQRNQLCRNCLRRGHMARDCSSESSCRKCGGRHHTQLCTGSFTPAAYTGITSCTSQDGTRSKVLLPTANIIMVDESGNEHHVRALLDSGSECCFVTEQLAQRMKVGRCTVNLPIAGIGQASTKVHCKFRSTVKSRISNYSTTIDAFILPKVTVDLPSISINVSSWPFPTGIHLADPFFFQSGPIDLVLGAEVFFDLFNVGGRIPLGESLPCLINTVFGWIVSGTTTAGDSRSSIICNMVTVTDNCNHSSQRRHANARSHTNPLRHQLDPETHPSRRHQNHGSFIIPIGGNNNRRSLQ